MIFRQIPNADKYQSAKCRARYVCRQVLVVETPKWVNLMDGGADLVRNGLQAFVFSGHQEDEVHGEGGTEDYVGSEVRPRGLHQNPVFALLRLQQKRESKRQNVQISFPIARTIGVEHTECLWRFQMTKPMNSMGSI